MANEPAQENLPYWINTPPERPRCLVCTAPGEAHCTLESHSHGVQATRTGNFSLHLFALCRDCLRLARKHPKILQAILEGKRR
jgi:hypothetical protein